jgi:hypothetical protein
MINQLYEFTMKVARGDKCDMPESMHAALVPTYVGAADYQDAIRKGVEAIRNLHYLFDNVHGQVREIPVDRWEEYVAKVWPEFITHFPSKEQLPALIEKGVVFFGPFSGFKE